MLLHPIALQDLHRWVSYPDVFEQKHIVKVRQRANLNFFNVSRLRLAVCNRNELTVNKTLLILWPAYLLCLIKFLKKNN